ncbi:crossover junction endodeoxyribonuclease RuvC [Patescibacteria group bacterium]
MIILGIDPGTATTGYGIIRKIHNKLELIDYGHISTSPQNSTSERLVELEKQLTKIIKKYKPEQVAVEDIFFFKNLKTAVKVSQARGVILATIERKKLPVYEYTPLQIKQAVASYGRADKNQVQQMTKLLLNLKEIPKPDDAADALAASICCAHSIKYNKKP